MDDNSVKIYINRIENFIRRVKNSVLSDERLFDCRFAIVDDSVPFDKRNELNYRQAKEEDIWGKYWDLAWFHLRSNVPAQWAGQKVVAHLDLSGEGLIYSSDGIPLQGITNGSVFDNKFIRDIFPLFDVCKGGEKVELWVEAAANGILGVHIKSEPPDGPGMRLGPQEIKIKTIRLALFNEVLWQYSLDMDVLFGMIKALPKKSVRSLRIIRALVDSINIYEENTENVKTARQRLQEELKKPATASDLSARAIGHAHLDTGWLWPVKESVRKCGRTFANQIALLKKYPQYVFGASQPQHYWFVKKHYPQLYKQVKKMVKEGRWEVQGAMWVEADTNLPSAESLIRQILIGKNFFMDEFGVDVKNLWLPDVFGYSASLPQILRKSGVDYFLTQKLSWNKYNKFPHQTFIWQGIDGSSVITHFPPEDYNSPLTSEYMINARDNFAERDFIDEFICLFGVGDGGGGPKAENIEYGLRMNNLEDAPKIRFGRAQDFFETLKQYEKKLAVWRGELYLEFHRGTYTTQALVKKMNRKIEQRLSAVEALWSHLPLDKYPDKELDEIWKILLINQFHDIIPGSSINAVYKTTHLEHREALERLLVLTDKAAPLLFDKNERSLVLFNSLSYRYRGLIMLPEHWQGAENSAGEKLRLQISGNKRFVFAEIAPFSFLTLKESAAEVAGTETRKELILENELIRYVFESDGTISEIYDKENSRNVLLPGKRGNRLTLYIDQPNNWDAWDVDIFYEEQRIEYAKVINSLHVQHGPLFQSMELTMTISKSKIRQKIVLAKHSKRLDFQTTVQWQERHRMLRVSFPVDINSEQAAFDIQYGYIMRNTHRNTSWDMAKFEVVGHKYADLSDPGYGVALLNNCKYGYKVYNKTLDLNLLRSPDYPDTEADIGEHEFIYSLLPHSGNLTRSEVMSEAAQLNRPPLLFKGYTIKSITPFVQIKSSAITIETLKKAEKEACLILRIVETKGARSHGKLIFRDKNTRLRETNLMEWEDGAEIKAENGEIDIQLKPFEIRTYKMLAE